MRAIIFGLFLMYSFNAAACESTREQRQAWFLTRDQNNDQKLTLEEYFYKIDQVSEENKKRSFSEVDTDRDGLISFEEYNTYRTTGPGVQKCE